MKYKNILLIIIGMILLSSFTSATTIFAEREDFESGVYTNWAISRSLASTPLDYGYSTVPIEALKSAQGQSAGWEGSYLPRSYDMASDYVLMFKLNLTTVSTEFFTGQNQGLGGIRASAGNFICFNNAVNGAIAYNYTLGTIYTIVLNYSATGLSAHIFNSDFSSELGTACSQTYGTANTNDGFLTNAGSWKIDNVCYFNGTTFDLTNYNDCVGIIAETTDYVNISTTYPINESIIDSSTININTTVNSTYDFNCSLYINSILNESDSYTSGSEVLVSFSKALNDGSYNYSFYCAQGNDTTQNETSSTNNFYIDTLNPVITNNNAATYFTNSISYNITATDLFLYSIMINDSCGNGYYNNSIASPFTLARSYYILTCSLGAQQTNITVCDNVRCVNDSISWTSMARLNITVENMITGLNINNFSVYNNGVLNGNTTTGVYFLDNLTETDYVINVDVPGFENSSANVTINSTYQTLQFTLYTTNSINFTFKDEITGSIVSGNNIAIELISDIYSNNYSTNDGTLYLDLLSPSEYAIRYSAENYTERFYYFNLQNRSHTDLTLYLASNTTAAEVTATVYDEGSRLIEDAYVKALRYDLESNSYIVQEIMKTNFEGKTQLHLFLNTEFYKFIIEYPLGTVKKETSPTYIYETTLNFQILLGEQVASNFYNSQDVSYSLVFNDDTNNFRYTYSDSNNIVSQGCLEVYSITSFGDTLYNSSCVSSATATILLGVDNSTYTTYRADSYVYFGTDKYYLGSEYKIFDYPNVGGETGLILITLLCIMMLFTAYWSLSVALILFPLPLFFGSILNIIDLSIGVTIPIEIVCVIIAIWISRRKQW